MAKIDKSQRPSFAKNISARRKSLGMSQNDLADRIGTHRNTIADIERGTSEGRPDTKQAIATALSCSVADLYSEIQSKSIDREIIDAIRAGVADVVGAPPAPFPPDIMEMIAQLSPRQMVDLTDVIRAVIQPWLSQDDSHEVDMERPQEAASKLKRG